MTSATRSVPGSCHYLDHACLGRPSPGVLEAVRLAAFQLANFCSTGTAQTLGQFTTVASARHRAAALINADPSDVVLIENTSRGLGLIASSLGLKQGDNVLVDDLEFLGASVAWGSACRRAGAELRAVHSVSGRILPENFAAYADARTRAIVVSSVQEVTGFRCDLEGIARVAHSRNAVVIADGIQEVGALPVDVRATDVDAYIAGGHKWLQSPFGLGFMYLHPRLREQLQPPYAGYMAIAEPPGGWEPYLESPARSPFDNLVMHTDARRFEGGGIPNFIGAVALDSAIAELLTMSPQRIWSDIQRLRAQLLDNVAHLPVNVIGNENKACSSSIVCVALRGGVNAERELIAELTRAGVYVSLRHVSGVGGLRVAMHYSNCTADIDKFLDVIESSSCVRREHV